MKEQRQLEKEEREMRVFTERMDAIEKEREREQLERDKEEEQRKRLEEERLFEQQRELEEKQLLRNRLIRRLDEINEEASQLKKAMENLEKDKRLVLSKLHEIDESHVESNNVSAAMTRDATEQTDLANADLEDLVKANASLKNKIETGFFSEKLIHGNDEKTKFYTGLSSWQVYLHLYMFLCPHVKSASSLSMEDQFFLVLVRLRLGLQVEDLADRFQIHVSMVSTVFQNWLEAMYIRLKFLIKWPSREVLQTNMPPMFKQLYPRCVCIIDCSEIHIETPTFYEARSKTYSNYKKNNTVKFLIAITPNGSICFLSKCWGGRVSDKVITQESNLFSHLLPGDVVLADRGFTLAEDFAVYGAKLEIPAFTKNKPQLLQSDVECSKQLSSVRIHVERVIGHLKKKYRILKGPLPVLLLKHKNDFDASNIDKILITCAALTNLTDTIV